MEDIWARAAPDREQLVEPRLDAREGLEHGRVRVVDATGRDALSREESCGCHFRMEHASPDGEAVRDDARFAHVAVWQHAGEGSPSVRHVEELTFEFVKPSTRSYK